LTYIYEGWSKYLKFTIFNISQQNYAQLSNLTRRRT